MRRSIAAVLCWTFLLVVVCTTIIVESRKASSSLDENESEIRERFLRPKTYRAADYEEEIAPWHLYEDAAAEARSQPLHLARNADNPVRIYDYEPDAPSFSYQPIEHTIHQQRARQEPRGDGTSYWYSGLFHHTHPDERAPTVLGPERPTKTTATSNVPSNAVTVAVYYYPWYHTDFHGRKYIRGELNPPQMPVLGEYNDRSSKVLARHLEWSRQANVNLWVTSWWGPDSETDITTSNYILKHRDLRDMKLCLFYETTGRIDVETNNTNRVYNDIAYAAETYFNHPNYHRIDGRPVMFVYLTRVLERRELLKDVLSKMRTAAFKKGHLLYIVGDHTYGSPPETKLKALDWLDAVTNYVSEIRLRVPVILHCRLNSFVLLAGYLWLHG